MCGEKMVPPPACFVTYGSPPRVRGEAAIRGHYTKHYRITPACAGRRMDVSEFQGAIQDHPRVCGEKSTPRKPRFLGSPPRARGEGCSPAGMTLSTGITPACAGRSPHRHASRARKGDHPRVRGEKDRYDYKTIVRKGSPPRARGEDFDNCRKSIRHGITPACAGRSEPLFTVLFRCKDHPRVRGEK